MRNSELGSLNLKTAVARAGQLEQAVAERTAKLREIIGELEGFSYSITHDLRAPLRALQSFSRLLLDDHSEKMDDVGKDFLRRIATSASRMDRLIQDIESCGARNDFFYRRPGIRMERGSIR